MNWLKTKIYTSTEGIEPLCGRLYSLGLNGVQIEDSADFNDFIENERQYWDYIDESLEPLKTAETNVTLYVTDDAPGHELLLLIRETVSALDKLNENGRFGRLEIETEGVCDEDWANNWKQYYKPFTLGERIYIRPEWVEGEAPDGRVALTMNPGHLFGTGTHDTTQMCMLELERLIHGGEKVLDLGCGSGILSVLSLLLGAEKAVAVDIDPAAPDTVGENLTLNPECSGKCQVYVGDVTGDFELHQKIGSGYDLVVANIVADVIISICAAAYSFMRSGAMFVCSGIISSRADEVLDALRAAGFEIVSQRSQNDWRCITSVKK